MSVVVIDRLIRGAAGTSPFAIVDEDDIAVSYVTVADNTARDAIPEWKRKAYMKAYSVGSSKEYRLGSDVTIAGQSWTEVPDITDYQPVSEKGQPGGYAPLDSDGFISPSYVRAIFSSTSFVVDDLAAMFALTTQTGDIVAVTADADPDNDRVYIKLNNDPATTDISDFAVVTNGATVYSVNSQTGAVEITITNLLARGTNQDDFDTAVANAPAVAGNGGAITGINLQIANILSAISTLQAQQIEVLLYDNSRTGGYAESNLVLYDGGEGNELYRCIADVPEGTNPTDTDYWEKIGAYYTKLEAQAYFNARLGGKDISNLITSPGAGNDLWSVVWDNTNSRYTLQAGAVANSFLSLSDTPSDYSGQSGKATAVKSAENGIEFVDFPAASPGGTDGQIQYNNNGVFDGLSGDEIPGIPIPFGKNWVEVTSFSSMTYLRAIGHASGTGILLVGGSGTGHIFRSVDYGHTWTDMGLIAANTTGINAIEYCGNGIFVAGTSYTGSWGQILVSTNYGVTWTVKKSISGIYGVNKVLYLTSGIVMAGVDNIGTIYRSTDYGQTWDSGNQLRADAGSFIQALDYGNGVLLVSCTQLDAELYKSVDDGASFTQITGTNIDGLVDIWALEYVDSDNWVMAIDNVGAQIQYSTDAGATWLPATTNPSGGNIANFEHVNGILFAGMSEASPGDGGAVAMSFDKGLTWINGFNTGEEAAFQLKYAERGILFLGTSSAGKLFKIVITPNETTPTPVSTAVNDFLLGNGTTFIKKTLAETIVILGRYDVGISDSATASLDLLSANDGISKWDSAQTASTLTISNAPAKGVRYLAINKQSTSDLAIQLVGTDVDANNLVFEFFDKTNECYTVGDTVTLVNAIGDTSFSLSLVFTGLYDGSGNLRVQVSGTYDSFSTA